MRRAFFIKSFVILATFMALVSSCGKDDGVVPLHAKILSFTGNFTINGASGKSGDILRTGDRIRTGENTTVHMLLADRGSLTIRSNTRLYLVEKGFKSYVHLEEGDLITAFHKIAKNQDLKIITPTAVAAVRGTHVFVKVHHKDHVYICTCHGAMHLQGHGHETGKVHESTYHNAAHFKRVNGTVVKEMGEQEHHTDEELEYTAGLIGKKIPWSEEQTAP